MFKAKSFDLIKSTLNCHTGLLERKMFNQALIHVQHTTAWRKKGASGWDRFTWSSLIKSNEHKFQWQWGNKLLLTFTFKCLSSTHPTPPLPSCKSVFLIELLWLDRKSISKVSSLTRYWENHDILPVQPVRQWQWPVEWWHPSAWLQSQRSLQSRP